MAYLLLGLLSVVCIVTGNLIWLQRRARSMRRIDVVLARLTAGGCGGAAVSLAALFLANQLLPSSLPDRPAWEHAAFYAGWCGSLAGALIWPRALESARVLLTAAGIAFLVLPAIDAARTVRLPLELAGSPWVFWADAGLLLFGAVFLAAGWTIRRTERVPQPTRIGQEVSSPAS